MTLVYFDSSAIVKLLIDEPGRADVVDLWDRTDVAVTSTVAYTEVRAAIAAAHRAGRLSSEGSARAVAEWDDYWWTMYPVEVTTAVAREGGHLAAEHRLRGADAVHLASMVVVGRPDTVVAVYDKRLRQAALDEGFQVTT